jgi:hypothetical protein
MVPPDLDIELKCFYIVIASDQRERGNPDFLGIAELVPSKARNLGFASAAPRNHFIPRKDNLFKMRLY